MRKFLGLSTYTAEGMGLATLVALSEVGFKSGFAYIGISIIYLVTVPTVYGLTGFLVKRYREARIVTVPEYAQRRYSKGVRIFTGAVLGSAGVLKLAIFPIVGSQFLRYFLDAPPSIDILGISVPFVPFLMAILILLALLFTYFGGMVTVLFTDFIQAIVISIAVFLITFLVIEKVGITQLCETVRTNFGAQGVNPLKNTVFGGPVFLIVIFLNQILGVPAFPPIMQRLAATDSANTARQWVLMSWLFSQGRALMVLVWGVGALAIMGAQAPNGMEEGLYTKIATAMYLGKLIPPLLFGIVVAGMLSCFISTVDSYMLSFATVLVNDVVCPILPRPLSEKNHVLLLKIMVAGIAGIAATMFLLGIVYQPAETVLEYFILTGMMMLGSGIIMIGGLYWKSGSSAGAYDAVATCCVLPACNLFLRRLIGQSYPFRTQDASLAAILMAVFLYVILSWLIPDRQIKQEDQK